jgi:hypothetical protein
MNAESRQREDLAQPSGRRRGGAPAWLPVVGGLLALGIIVAMGVYALRKGDATPATIPPVTETRKSLPGPAAEKPSEANRLIGRWLRPDGNYMLEIRSASADGKVAAAYYNPSPINVSKAEVSSEDGRVRLFVQLTGGGYEGSYYTLAYDPGTDRLAGVYHQLSMGQEFEVEFVRMEQ